MMNSNPYYNAPMGAPAQPYMNYGMPYGGVAPMPQPVQPKMTQILSPEDINTLKAKNTSFNINVDPIDILRANCVHRENGNFKIVDNGDGTVTCSICGETFTPIYSADDGNVEAIVKQNMDLLNTIKLAYVDLPPEMGREYFPIIELIKKIPALYKIAMNDLNKYTNIQQQQNNGGGYGNAFTNLNMITSGYGSYYQPQPYGAYPAPGYGYDPNQTFMPGQPTPASMAQQNIPMTPSTPPVYNPYAMNQVPANQNPFNMYAQPQVPAQAPVNPYVPQTQAPAPVAPAPGMMSQPVPAPPTSTPAPVPPTAPEQNVTVTETIKV